MRDQMDTQERQKQEKPLSPAMVFDKALAFMSARWLCVGSPDRDKLATQYCEASLDEKKRGISLQRINQELLLYSSTCPDIDPGEQLEAKQVREGASKGGCIPEKFLLPQETIPFSALEFMTEWCASFLGGRQQVDKVSFKDGEVPELKSQYLYKDIPFQAPISFFKWSGRTGGLAVSAKSLARQARNKETQDFFETFSGYDTSLPNVAACIAGPALGRIEVSQDLIIFSDGSFVHKVGSDPAGIYEPHNSVIKIYARERRMQSPIEISDFTQFVVFLIKQGESYTDKSGQVITWQNSSPTFLKSHCKSLPQEVLVSGNARKDDSRLELAPFYNDSKHINFFRSHRDSVLRLPSDWSDAWKPAAESFNSGSIVLEEKGISERVALLNKDAVGVSDDSLFFLPKGEVISESGNWLSSPGKNRDCPLLLNDGGRITISSIGGVVDRCKAEPSIKDFTFGEDAASFRESFKTRTQSRTS